ncbi:MAG: PAS domain-containing protein, partial [Frankia sp.]|nr:PAS domain-containing protein [Frankia sp.]
MTGIEGRPADGASPDHPSTREDRRDHDSVGELARDTVDGMTADLTDALAHGPVGAGREDGQHDEAAERAGWAMFQRIAAACPVPVFVADAGGRLLFVNASWSELTGIEPADAVGQGWQDTLHPGDLPTVTRQWERARDGDDDAVWARVRLRRPDGVARAAILRAMPTARHARPTRFIGTLTALPPLPDWQGNGPRGAGSVVGGHGRDVDMAGQGSAGAPSLDGIGGRAAEAGTGAAASQADEHARAVGRGRGAGVGWNGAGVPMPRRPDQPGAGTAAPPPSS